MEQDVASQENDVDTGRYLSSAGRSTVKIARTTRYSSLYTDILTLWCARSTYLLLASRMESGHGHDSDILWCKPAKCTAKCCAPRRKPFSLPLTMDVVYTVTTTRRRRRG
ncbi:hypothetical protein M0804_001120 [Polistes exclamans]|nr:hypothetical protein M0804_001120 [Polistes exclamans]